MPGKHPTTGLHPQPPQPEPNSLGEIQGTEEHVQRDSGDGTGHLRNVETVEDKCLGFFKKWGAGTDVPWIDKGEGKEGRAGLGRTVG